MTGSVDNNDGAQQEAPVVREPLPRAWFHGELQLGTITVPCYVLDNGTRLISHRGLTSHLGGTRGTPSQRSQSVHQYREIPTFLSASNLQPFIPSELVDRLMRPIEFSRPKGGRSVYGLEATLVVDICNVWLEARKHGVLRSNQQRIAERAEMMMRAFANVGIIALIDEATGYQSVRDRDALLRILEAYIAKELLPWTQRFPNEFYEQLFRLRQWKYSPPSPKRPMLVGRLTNDIVYSRLPAGVLDELRELNPVGTGGRRRHKHHQFLTEDIGQPHLEKHLVGVIALMRASPNWGAFKRLLERSYPKPDPSTGMIQPPLYDLGSDDVDTEL